jgi:SAM-dependent methyltransferase
MNTINRFIQIDDEGYFLSSGIRITDEEYGQSLLENLRIDGKAYVTESQDQKVFVEAFDEPLVARSVDRAAGTQWILNLPYQSTVTFDLSTLCVDDWDRFHGRTSSGLPFVLSRSAQMQFFDLVDSFDDDSITVDGKRFEIKTLNQLDKLSLDERLDINGAEFWSESYRKWVSAETTPAWELNEPAKPLREVVPQIKIPKSRICILGCGLGNDAAFLASLGHIVTAVELSPDALLKAREKHPEGANLKFVEADAFQFAKKFRGEFDIIFEHTFFCAIDPDRRQELVQAWRSLLIEGGHLLAIFYVFERLGGPPFGTSEWEVRELLSDNFEFLNWTRWKTSIERRMGRELVVYARKRS